MARSEVTGRRVTKERLRSTTRAFDRPAAKEEPPIPRLGYTKLSKNRRPGDALTIKAFCQRNAISEALFFTLQRLGKGPRTAKLLKRTVIFPEAEADWRREREAETTAKRAAKREAASAEASSSAA